MIDVTIVVVNYNTFNYLDKCLKSVINYTNCSYEIIIIDNCSTDSSVSKIKSSYPEVTLIENNRNMGFSYANNQAFNKARGRYIFMLNPDTIILNDAIGQLMKYMDTHQHVGASGPKVMNPDLTLQYTCHHFPSIIMRVIDHLGLGERYPENRLFGREFMTYRDYNEEIKADWLTGCALMIRKSVLNETGQLDENYFLYAEEMDLCYRINQCNYAVMYVPFAEIIHYHGGSSENLTGVVVRSRNVIEHLFISRYFYFKKNHGILSLYAIRIIDLVFYSARYFKRLILDDKDNKKDQLSHLAYILSIIVRKIDDKG